jgi:hypothetical protein
MGKKFVQIQKRNLKYRLFLVDIKKVHKVTVKKFPPIPVFEQKDVSGEISTDNELSFEPMVLSQH